MPDVTNSTMRKCLGDLLKTRYDEDFSDYGIAQVDVKNASALDVENIGKLLIWDSVDTAFNILTTAADAAGTTDNSPLPNQEAFCIAIGSSAGVGKNDADTSLSTTAVKMTVLYRGPATIFNSGIEWDSFNAGDQATIIKAFEANGIHVESTATTVTPNYTS